MKKITLILLLTLTVSFSVCAEDSGKMMSFDIGTGLSLPFFSFEALEDIWGTSEGEVDVLTIMIHTLLFIYYDIVICV